MANSAGYKMYAGLVGSNVLTVGAEDSIFNYTDLATAVAAAKPKDMILVYPGTYTQTTSLTINKDLTVIGVGGPYDVLITSALTTSTVNLNMPASNDATVAINLANLKILNSTTGTALDIDNDGGAAYDMYVNVQDCIVLNTSTGYAVVNSHTTNTKDMFITITGAPNIHRIGKSSFAKAKALSSTIIHGMKCEGAFELGATAVASTFTMINCIYASAAQTTGGNGAQLNNYLGNVYGATLTAGVLTIGAANDFDAAGTESAVLYALT